MAVIAAQTATGTSNLASTLVTWGNNTTTGNTIIVVVGNSSTSSGDVSSVTDSQGNLYQKVFTTDNASIGDLEVWYSAGILGGTTPTITVAYTTGVACAVIAREYWGLYVPSQSPFDQQNSATGNSTAPSSGNVQLKQPIELLIGACLTPINTTYSLGSGFSNLQSLNGTLTVSVAIEDQYVTSIGPWSATFGIGAVSLQWVCGIATFYQAPAGTTTSTSFTTSTSTSSTSISSTSSSISSTSASTSTSSTSTSFSSTSSSISSTSVSISSTSISSTSSSTSISSTSTSISSTSTSSTSQSSTSSSTSVSSTSSSFSSTSSSISSTSSSVSSTSVSSTSSSSSTSTTLPPPGFDYSYQDSVSSIFNVIQSASGSTGATGIPSTLSLYLSNSTKGSSLVLSLTSISIPTPTITDTLGNTWSQDASFTGAAGGNIIVLHADNNIGGPVTILITIGTNSKTSATVYEVLGGPLTLDTNVSAHGSSGNPPSVSSGTLISNNEIIFGVSSNTSGSIYTLGAGFTGLGNAWTFSSSNINIGTQFQVVNSTAAVTNTMGLNTPASSNILSVSYYTKANSDMLNAFKNPQYQDVSADDGDYFIQTGSKNVIALYEQVGANNTSNINVTWKGRTTIAPSVSPVYLQIFNNNSGAWETLASQTIMPADVDFTLQGSQTTNLSNYYDSQNIVNVRVYQQVN